MPESRKNVLILISGGIDSTACIRFFKKLKFHVEGIFFDYGQLSLSRETRAVKKIVQFYNIPLKIVHVKGNREFSNGLISGRNAAFYFLALMNFKNETGSIASGIHAGTSYYDCSQTFLDQVQGTFDGYSNGTIKVAAPFINFSKKDIWQFCKKEKVPLHLTYSCELGKKQPCGKCDTCIDLEMLYAGTK